MLPVKYVVYSSIDHIVTIPHKYLHECSLAIVAYSNYINLLECCGQKKPSKLEIKDFKLKIGIVKKANKQDIR